MTKLAALFPDVRTRPLRAGLAWAALFVPVSALIHSLTGDPMSLDRLLILVPLAIVGGLVWGLATKWFLDRRDRDA